MTCVPSSSHPILSQEIEQRRIGHSLRVLQLPSSREERAVVRADGYAAAVLADAARAETVGDRAALEAAARVLPTCVGVAVYRAELETALRGEADVGVVLDALLRHNWLLTSERPRTTAADEVPSPPHPTPTQPHPNPSPPASHPTPTPPHPDPTPPRPTLVSHPSAMSSYHVPHRTKLS